MRWARLQGFCPVCRAPIDDSGPADADPHAQTSSTKKKIDLGLRSMSNTIFEHDEEGEGEVLINRLEYRDNGNLESLPEDQELIISARDAAISLTHEVMLVATQKLATGSMLVGPTLTSDEKCESKDDTYLGKESGTKCRGVDDDDDDDHHRPWNDDPTLRAASKVADEDADENYIPSGSKNSSK